MWLRTALGHEVLFRFLAGLNGGLVGRPFVVTLLRCFYVRRRARSRSPWRLGSGRDGGLGRRGRGRRALSAAFPDECLLGLPARLNGCFVGCPFIVALFGGFLLSCGRNRRKPEHRCRTNQDNKAPIHCGSPSHDHISEFEGAQRRLGSVSLALFHIAGLGGTREWLAVFADRAVFAAFLDGTGPRCTGKRFAVLADGLGRAAILGDCRPDSEQRDQNCSGDDPSHFLSSLGAFGCNGPVEYSGFARPQASASSNCSFKRLSMKLAS